MAITTPVTNTQIIFSEHPDGYPDPNKTVIVDKSTINFDKEPLDGGVLVKVLVLSIDPYLRGMMNKVTPYGVGASHGVLPCLRAGFKIGNPIFTYGISKVIRSENPHFCVGDHLYGIHPSVEYAVLKDLSEYRRIEDREGLPWSTYLGVCGMPGRTAHHGYMEYVKPHAKKGDTIFVTTGAGPVGSLVIQLAKLDGLKVIASAGSDEKVNFMEECGADVAFNYKTACTKEMLAKHGPINFYWDHVGGDILDSALEACANFAHIVVCGSISGYNEQPKPVNNFALILLKNLTVHGFLVCHLKPKYASDFWNSVPPKVASGEFKHREDIRHGLESVGQALLDVQTGRNYGKTVIVLAED